MRIGVYVDGFNLYYGARGVCGRGTAGWRWLAIRSLAQTIAAARLNWQPTTIDRVVYCTARISKADNASGYKDQGTYIKALTESGNTDLIEFGNYVSRVKTAPLAIEDSKGRPVLVLSQWPVMVKNSADQNVNNARFIVSHARREEKGSDVNVASHLLIDIFSNSIDGAIVISNDSDLAFPVSQARKRIPVGVVNPSSNVLAAKLAGTAGEGVGRHFWRQLVKADFTGHQLPDPVGTNVRPVGW